MMLAYRGGEGGIRTPDRLAPMPHFECGAFDHSATSPGANSGDSSPAVGASSRRGWRARQGAAAKISAPTLKRDEIESSSRFSSLFEHDLFGKPLHTFPD